MGRETLKERGRGSFSGHVRSRLYFIAASTFFSTSIDQVAIDVATIV